MVICSSVLDTRPCEIILITSMFSILHINLFIFYQKLACYRHSSGVSIHRYYIPVYLCIIGLFIVYSYIFITIRRQVSWNYTASLYFKSWLSLTYRLNNSVSLCVTFKTCHRNGSLSYCNSQDLSFYSLLPLQRSRGHGVNPFSYMCIGDGHNTEPQSVDHPNGLP